MPATARRLAVTNIYDPKEAIEGGVKYMRILLDMFSHDIYLTLAGYNAGEGAVMKYAYQFRP
jgi:soluble lytic murein transglycosylase-like protein